MLGKEPGFMWRNSEQIIDEIGLAPLDLIAEIRRLENKVQLAYQMANHFDGNANVPGYRHDPTWAAAARMLRVTLDD